MILATADGGIPYTVTADARLHLTNCWLSATGTIVVSEVLFALVAGPHTIFGGTGQLNGLDVVVPAGETVTITGTGGAIGYEEPAIG